MSATSAQFFQTSLIYAFIGRPQSVPGTISLIQNTVRWRSDQVDGAVVTRYLGTPGQTKVSGDRQRETTHESCCLAAE